MLLLLSKPSLASISSHAAVAVTVVVDSVAVDDNCVVDVSIVIVVAVVVVAAAVVIVNVVAVCVTFHQQTAIVSSPKCKRLVLVPCSNTRWAFVVVAPVS